MVLILCILLSARADFDRLNHIMRMDGYNIQKFLLYSELVVDKRNTTFEVNLQRRLKSLSISTYE